MKEKGLSEEARAFFREQGRQGGLLSGEARMKKLTPATRRRIARKASKAAAEARRAKKEQEG